MADPICRWRNSTVKQVCEFNQILPKNTMLKTAARALIERNLKLWDGSDNFFRTAYQLAVQMALYFEDDKFMYVRFDKIISLNEANEYLTFWARNYYVPNPYTVSLKLEDVNGNAPVIINRFLVNWIIDNGETSWPTLKSRLFPNNNIGNDDILQNLINSFFEVEIVDNIVRLKDGIEISKYENIYVEADSNDRAAFFNHFSKTNARTTNTILYGPPGTGKTFKMQQIFAQYGEDSRSMVTFHQSYSYEEFIVGLTAKTDEEGKVIYEYKKGVFYNACETAAKLAGYTDLADCCQDTKESRETRFAEIASDPSKQFLFCIDEINRANISSVFGDLISLIEEDKRLGTKNEMIVKLPYNQALFGVPANLHLLGTMNTADRSIQILDTALRRRFHFRELMPNYDVIKNETARNILTAINCRVRALLNKDRQIGHSYFFSIPEESSDAEIQILEAIRHKIIPLLQEYFYNEIGKIRFVMGEKGEPSSETDFFIYDEEANSSYRDYDADNEDVLFYKLNLKMLDEASVDNTKAKTILNHITQ